MSEKSATLQSASEETYSQYLCVSSPPCKLGICWRFWTDLSTPSVHVDRFGQMDSRWWKDGQIGQTIPSPAWCRQWPGILLSLIGVVQYFNFDVNWYISTIIQRKCLLLFERTYWPDISSLIPLYSENRGGHSQIQFCISGFQGSLLCLVLWLLSPCQWPYELRLHRFFIVKALSMSRRR